MTPPQIWLANMKVGEELAIEIYAFGFLTGYEKGVVTRVTETQIEVQREKGPKRTSRYRRTNGKAFGSQQRLLVPLTEEVRLVWRREAALEVIRYVDWGTISTEKLEVVAKACEGAGIITR